MKAAITDFLLICIIISTFLPKLSWSWNCDYLKKKKKNTETFKFHTKYGFLRIISVLFLSNLI